MTLEFVDPLHGIMKFDSTVICEIINSVEMQRLKDIDMGGYSIAFHPGVRFSRFEHSLGVCFLLKLANASLEEQIHGLIHDVNHTVFSHAIDYALPSGSEADQNYQDENFSNFVSTSSINEILIAMNGA